MADALQIDDTLTVNQEDLQKLRESGRAKFAVCVDCRFVCSAELTQCPNEGGMLVPLVEDPLIGTIFANNYKIISAIGKGGMGSVYKAEHILMRRIVALKVLSGDSANLDAIKRFQQESQAIAALSHPNIIGVHDFGISDGGKPFLVMEHVNGQDLGDAVLSREFSLTELVEIFKKLCDALSHAHESGVVHRDLKPSNIVLFENTDGTHTVKVLDFGIAKLLPASGKDALAVTATAATVGSPYYMSPEQIRGETPDGRSDIYSLGCVMYEVVSGVRAFDGHSLLEVMHKHVQQKVLPFESACPDKKIPSQLEAIILKTLEKKASLRFQSMSELKDALCSLKLNTETARVSGRPTRYPLFIAIAATVIGLITFLAFQWHNDRHSETSPIANLPVQQPVPQPPVAVLPTTNTASVNSAVPPVNPPLPQPPVTLTAKPPVTAIPPVIITIPAQPPVTVIAGQPPVALIPAGPPVTLIPAGLAPAKLPPISPQIKPISAVVPPRKTTVPPVPSDFWTRKMEEGKAQFASKNFEGARDSFAEALAEAKKTDSVKSIWKHKIEQGDSALTNGNKVEAAKEFQNALQEAEKIGKYHECVYESLQKLKLTKEGDESRIIDQQINHTVKHRAQIQAIATLLTTARQQEDQRALALKSARDKLDKLDNVPANLTAQLDFVDCMGSVANLNWDSTKHESALAEAQCLKALSIARRFLGENNADYIRPLERLGIVYRCTARHAEALDCWVQVLSFYNSAYKSDPGYQRSLGNLNSQMADICLFILARPHDAAVYAKDGFTFLSSCSNADPSIVEHTRKTITLAERFEEYERQAQDENQPDHLVCIDRLINAYRNERCEIGSTFWMAKKAEVLKAKVSP